MKKRNKVKPGEIRFIPTDNRLMESAPFANNLTNLPDWFRRISKEGAALRKCVGTIDLLAAGVTLPMWTNYRFRPDNNGTWETGADDFYPSAVAGGQPTSIGQASGFNHESTGECPMTSVRKIETGQYPKLINPWRMETAPGWSTLIVPCYWEPSEDYTVVPAIVHTDYYHSINVVLNLTGDRAFMLKYNTPIAQLIPFKRDSDFTKVLFSDESDFKYYASTGFGSGFVSPRETGATYRRERMRVDKELEGENSSGGLFSKVFKRG